MTTVRGKPVGLCPHCKVVIEESDRADLSRASHWDDPYSGNPLVLIHPLPACDWFMVTPYKEIRRSLLALPRGS